MLAALLTALACACAGTVSAPGQSAIVVEVEPDGLVIDGFHLEIFPNPDVAGCFDAVLTEAAQAQQLAEAISNPNSTVRLRLVRIPTSELPEIIPPTYHYDEDDRVLVSSSASIYLAGRQAFLRCQGNRIDDFEIYSVLDIASR